MQSRTTSSGTIVINWTGVEIMDREGHCRKDKWKNLSGIKKQKNFMNRDTGAYD